MIKQLLFFMLILVQHLAFAAQAVEHKNPHELGQTKPYIIVNISVTGLQGVYGFLPQTKKIFELDMKDAPRKQKAFKKGMEMAADKSLKKPCAVLLNPNDEFEDYKE